MTDKTAHFLSLSVQGKCIMEYKTHPIGTENLLNFSVRDVYGQPDTIHRTGKAGAL